MNSLRYYFLVLTRKIIKENKPRRSVLRGAYSALISSVQSTATLLSTPLEKVSLDISLRNCIDVFKKDYQDVSVTNRITTTQAIIHADQFIDHLIMNMLSNAEKHNQNDRKNIWIDLIEDDDGYTLTIADNGPGISDAMKKNLLNPERRSGGIGIHQCIQIVGKYKGTFEILDRIEGDYTQGAKFRVWLPKVND